MYLIDIMAHSADHVTFNTTAKNIREEQGHKCVTEQITFSSQPYIP